MKLYEQSNVKKVRYQHQRLTMFAYERNMQAERIERWSNTPKELAEFGITGAMLSPYGGMTIAWVEIGSITIIAKAICSAKDKFSRYLGRTVATTRLRHVLEAMGYSAKDCCFLLGHEMTKPTIIDQGKCIHCGYRPSAGLYTYTEDDTDEAY